MRRIRRLLVMMGITMAFVVSLIAVKSLVNDGDIIWLLFLTPLIALLLEDKDRKV